LAKGGDTVKQYDIINQCREILKYSEINAMEKLRMENLLIQMKMLLLVDIYKQETMPEIFSLPNFEELFTRMKEVCSPGVAADHVQGLVDHIRKMHSAMAEYLNKIE
jgi:hypothetical protein